MILRRQFQLVSSMGDNGARSRSAKPWEGSTYAIHVTVTIPDMTISLLPRTRYLVVSKIYVKTSLRRHHRQPEASRPLPLLQLASTFVSTVLRTGTCLPIWSLAGPGVQSTSYYGVSRAFQHLLPLLSSQKHSTPPT